MRLEKLKKHHHDELSQKLIQQKSAFAFVTDEGETIACAGIVEMAWHTAGEIWFKKGLAIKQGTIEMLRHASRLLEEEMQRIGMISIMFTVTEKKMSNLPESWECNAWRLFQKWEKTEKICFCFGRVCDVV